MGKLERKSAGLNRYFVLPSGEGEEGELFKGNLVGCPYCPNQCQTMDTTRTQIVKTFLGSLIRLAVKINNAPAISDSDLQHSIHENIEQKYINTSTDLDDPETIAAIRRCIGTRYRTHRVKINQLLG